MPPTLDAEHHGNKQLTTLFSQYQKLCQYCDNAFSTAQDAFQADMQCAKGCASCCILETVIPLEAHLIAAALSPSGMPKEFDKDPSEGDRCIFLHRNACTIYAVRPMICRTHGLPIRYPDRLEIDVCPLNFTDRNLDSLNTQWILSAETVTDNLMRLNLAFCMLIQHQEIAGERIPLRWLLDGKDPLNRMYPETDL